MKKLLILTIVLIGSYFALERYYPEYRAILGIKSFQIDETAGWKTYRDERSGFELKYPMGWEFVEDQLGVVFFPKTPLGMSKEKRESLSEGWPNLRITALVNIGGLGARSLFEKSTLPNLRKDIDHNVRDIKIGGVNAIKYIDLGMFDTQHYIIVSSNRVLYVSLGGGEIDKLGSLQKIVDDIVSTLKFINPPTTYLDNLVLITTNWNTYKPSTAYTLVPSICGEETVDNKIKFKNYLDRFNQDKNLKVLDGQAVKIYYTPNYLNWTAKQFLSFRFDCVDDEASIELRQLFAYPDRLVWFEDFCNFAVNNLIGDGSTGDQMLIDKQEQCKKDRDLLVNYFKGKI